MEKIKGVEYIEAAVKEYLHIDPSSMGQEKARQQDLNRNVWEESLKEKDEIISARTQADLAAKGRDKLEHLKDTRKELKNL